MRSRARIFRPRTRTMSCAFLSSHLSSGRYAPLSTVVDAESAQHLFFDSAGRYCRERNAITTYAARQEEGTKCKIGRVIASLSSHPSLSLSLSLSLLCAEHSLFCCTTTRSYWLILSQKSIVSARRSLANDCRKNDTMRSMSGGGICWSPSVSHAMDATFCSCASIFVVATVLLTLSVLRPRPSPHGRPGSHSHGTVGRHSHTKRALTAAPLQYPSHLMEVKSINIFHWGSYSTTSAYPNMASSSGSAGCRATPIGSPSTDTRVVRCTSLFFVRSGNTSDGSLFLRLSLQMAD